MIYKPFHDTIVNIQIWESSLKCTSHNIQRFVTFSHVRISISTFKMGKNKYRNNIIVRMLQHYGPYSLNISMHPNFLRFCISKVCIYDSIIK